MGGLTGKEDIWSRWLKEERWGDHRAPLEAALAGVRDRILALAALQPGERVLDLGCGTGLLGLRAVELVRPGGGRRLSGCLAAVVG